MNSPALSPSGSALAMSGGGFRSTLFQVGALWRMNELGLLPDLKCVSGVSGGSIAAAQLGLAWKSLAFGQNKVGNPVTFKKAVVDPLMVFCSKTIDIPAAIDALVNPFKSGGQVLQESLQKDLFGDKKLSDLPGPTDGGPRFVFNATNLQTGVRFWTSREDLGDYQIGYTTNTAGISVALAVAASAAFPPIFTPLEFSLPPGPYTACVNPVNHHTMGVHVTDPGYHHVAQLCDGGTYDNLGLQELLNPIYETLWVSDASSAFVSYTNYLAQAHWYQPHMLVTLLRVIDTMMRSAEARRRSDFIDELKGKTVKGAYWGTTTSLTNAAPQNALPLNPAVVAKLSELDTMLRDFGEPIRQQLVNWGYAIADRQIRSWGMGPWPASAIPPKWPYPSQPLG
jgi:NTE family protein